MKPPAEPPASHATRESRAESWQRMLDYAGLGRVKRKGGSRGHHGGSPWSRVAACFKRTLPTR